MHNPVATAPEILVPRWIAPVEPAGVVLENQAVVIQDRRIAAIGPLQTLLHAWPQARRIDLPHHLVTPGFVNLHSHAAMALLRGAADDLPLEQWLNERIWPMEAQLLGEDFVFDGSVLACAEMLRSGITCFNDMYFFPESTVRAARIFNLRAAVAIVVLDFPTPWASGPDEYLRKGLDMRDHLHDQDRIHCTLGPHAPYSVADGPMREIAKLAAELSMPIHIHVHETAHEVAQGIARYGRRPLARLAELGILGPETLAVHAVHLDASDIALLAATGAHVAHCPHSNLKLGSGIAPIAKLLAAGVPVGIGTDGSASNNRLDLLAEARTATLLAKGATADASVWGAHSTLESMTLRGARALGLDHEIGSLKVGKCADLLAFDLNDPALKPVYDPVSQLIYAAERRHLDAVWMDGQLVVHQQQFKNPETARVLAEVAARAGVWQTKVVKILSASASPALLA